MIDVPRSAPPPTSLCANTSYSGEDVKDRLEADFLGKCYLCEGLLTGAFEVEHLKPRARFPELQFEWSNLYPAHPHSCNQRRLAYPSGDLLDPAAQQDVEGRLYQSFSLMDRKQVVPEFLAVDQGDPPAVNTALELSHLHDASPHGRRLRGAIYEQYRRVQGELLEWLMAREAGDDRLQKRHGRRLRALLQRDAPYYGLLRTKLREDYDSDSLKRVGLGFLVT